MIRRSLLPLALLAILGGCVSPPEAPSEADSAPPIRDRTIGPWKNRYAGARDLAGVVVQQFPDCAGVAAEYEGRHPAMILYVFRDGRVDQCGFEPSGTLVEDFWWRAPPDHWLWGRLEAPPR